MLTFLAKKLRHYMQAYTIHLKAHANLIKYVLSKSILSRRLARWRLLFIEHERIYIPGKVVKGHAFVDFLANHPIPTHKLGNLI